MKYRKNLILYKYIYWSTITSIFTEALYIKSFVAIKYFYIVIIVNTILLIMIKKYKLNKYHLLVLFLLFLINIYNVIMGNNILKNFLFQFIGIAIISAYYYNFFKLNYKSISAIMNDYANISFIIAILGIVAVIFNLDLAMSGRPSERLHSILIEPSHYCVVVLPALYYSLYITLYEKNKILRSFILLLSIILTQSSVGLLGLLLILILLFKKHFIAILSAMVIFPIIITIIFTSSEHFTLRFNDTVQSLSSGDLSGSNLSTYAFLSNLGVALNVFENHPMIGNGLGSHESSYYKYIGHISGSENFSQELNTKDANSFFIRTLSESGLVGLFAILLFILKFRPIGNFNNNYISEAILIYFFVKLLRSGHYFPPEMFFFTFIYVFNGIQQNKNLKYLFNFKRSKND